MKKNNAQYSNWVNLDIKWFVMMWWCGSVGRAWRLQCYSRVVGSMDMKKCENACTHYCKLLWIRDSTKMEKEWIDHLSFHIEISCIFKKQENIYQASIFIFLKYYQINCFVQIIIRLKLQMLVNTQIQPFTSPVLVDQYLHLQRWQIFTAPPNYFRWLWLKPYHGIITDHDTYEGVIKAYSTFK
jgi:hypothetical protein